MNIYRSASLCSWIVTWKLAKFSVCTYGLIFHLAYSILLIRLSIKLSESMLWNMARTTNWLHQTGKLIHLIFKVKLWPVNWSRNREMKGKCIESRSNRSPTQQHNRSLGTNSNRFSACCFSERNAFPLYFKGMGCQRVWDVVRRRERFVHINISGIPRIWQGEQRKLRNLRQARCLFN